MTELEQTNVSIYRMLDVQVETTVQFRANTIHFSQQLYQPYVYAYALVLSTGNN